MSQNSCREIFAQDGQKANVIRCQKLHLRRGTKKSKTFQGGERLEKISIKTYFQLSPKDETERIFVLSDHNVRKNHLFLQKHKFCEVLGIASLLDRFLESVPSSYFVKQ